MPQNTSLVTCWDTGLRSAGTRSVHFEKELVGRYRDPLTPPHTRGPECVRTEEIDHTGIFYCAEYRVFYQWMYCKAVLVLDFADGVDSGTLDQALTTCLQGAAVAGTLAAFAAAFATGGAAAAEAFKDAFLVALVACLSGSIPQQILSARIAYPCNWGDWE